MVRVNPLMERNLGIVENGAYGHCELGATVATEPQAGAGTLAGGLRREAAIVVHTPAVRANRTIRPADRLKVRAGGFLVMEAGFGMDGGVIGLCGHRLTSL